MARQRMPDGSLESRVGRSGAGVRYRTAAGTKIAHGKMKVIAETGKVSNEEASSGGVKAGLRVLRVL